MTRTVSQKRRAKQARGNVVARKRTTVNIQYNKKPKNINKKTKKSKRIAYGWSQCAADYLSVLENPFSGKAACVPAPINFPSMKHNVFSRGSFSTGTTGVGAVMANPYAGVINGPLQSSDTTPLLGSAVLYTTSAFASSSFPISSYALPAGVVSGNTNSPYSTGNAANDGLTTRIVACGLRIRNTTPLLNRGGSCLGLETINHTTLSGINETTAAGNPNARLINISDGEWHSIVFHPEDPEDMDYLNPGTAYQHTQAEQVYGRFFRYILGFIVTSNPANTQTFDFENFTVFEAKGTSVPTLTPSYSDPIGLGRVQNITATVQSRVPKTGDRSGWVDSLMSVPGAASIVATAGSAYLANGFYNDARAMYNNFGGR